MRFKLPIRLCLDSDGDLSTRGRGDFPVLGGLLLSEVEVNAQALDEDGGDGLEGFSKSEEA